MAQQWIRLKQKMDQRLKLEMTTKWQFTMSTAHPSSTFVIVRSHDIRPIGRSQIRTTGLQGITAKK
eukprot:scaffold22748_cov182-Cylindrotheca_fusiformis.AAC.4